LEGSEGEMGRCDGGRIFFTTEGTEEHREGKR
jgi:hypothetical protein